MITQVKIENFRCLQNVQVTLKNFNVLVGMNDSGKSSFLEVFEILHKSSHEDTSQMFPEHLRKHIWQQDLEKKVGITVEWDTNASYQLVLGQVNTATAPIKSATIIASERLIIKGEECYHTTRERLRTFFGEFLSIAPLIDNNKGHLPEIPGVQAAILRNNYPEVQTIWQFFNNIKSYSFIVDKLRQPAPVRKIEAGMDSDGFGLPAYLAALKLEEDERFFQIVHALHEVIPRIKAINISQVGQQNLYELSFTDINSGIKIPASVCSDGVLLFLAYLTLLHSPTPPSLILIEEPENGVHPHRLESIVSYLKKLSQTQVNGQTPQIIVTTHSPYLLDYVEEDEVLVFYRSKKDGATVVKRLSEIPDFAAKKKGFLLGEFWTAFGEEALIGEEDSLVGEKEHGDKN